jgi:predicted Zn-dependent protease
MRYTGNHLLTQIRGALSHKLAQVVFGIGATLVLFGAVTNDRVLIAVVLLVCVRLVAIANEAFKKRYSAADWHARQQFLVDAFSQMSAEEFAEEIDGLGLLPPVSPRELARAVVVDEQHNYVAPRPRAELATEGLGLLTLVLILPLTIAFYTREFVSLRLVQDWMGLLVVVACAGLYLWPLRWRQTDEQHRNRIVWWGVPVLPVLGLFSTGLTQHHTYLDPTAPKHLQQAADKVLALPDTIVAGRHPDWVFDYAVTLAQSGDVSTAIDYYQRGLKLVPQSHAARAQLAVLQAQLTGVASHPMTKNNDPHRPYWAEGRTVIPLPVCAFDARIENISTTTVVVVRSGNITPDLANHVGDVINRILKVPVCIGEKAMLLPEHTRTRGILVGRQWDVTSLAESFISYIDPMPQAPLKFVILTDVDIYAGDANFVFSTSYEWGAILSSAKFSEMGGSPNDLNIRTAKQSLGALLKAFDIPSSDDPNCVTSYTNGLDQFDAKGNYPNATTLALFVQQLDRKNTRWTTSKLQ